MLCPRCGNEWDATKGSCTHCGFIIRTANPSGPLPRLHNSPQRGNQQSGRLSGPKQQAGGPTTPAPPGFPRTTRPAPPGPMPQQDSTFGSNQPPSASSGALTKPAFEKNALRKNSTSEEHGLPQTRAPRTDSLSFKSSVRTPPPFNRTTDQQQQDVRFQQTPAQTPPLQSRANLFPAESPVRNAPNQQEARPVDSFQQAPSRPGPMRTNTSASGSNIRPLLPGVLLRSGRYRLQELQERQDWLSGVFEATWTGKDSQRGASQVTICEMVLPESTSVMAQTILRTATVSLASVGRHPRIPTLWDAFSDQGRSFFVFEPVEGESLMARMRFSGRALPEHEVIECCLQMTDVLDLLTQQSPQLVHGLIRPEHIIIGRNGTHYILTNFSIVLAGGATQYIAGLERSRLSPYTAPEFARGVADVRTDLYSLVATAYHAATGSVPASIGGSVPQAQRINPNVSSAFDAILAKGLRAVANQRYQRPSEFRQDLLAMRSVRGTLVPDKSSVVSERSNPSPRSRNDQRADVSRQHESAGVAQALPIPLNTNDEFDEEASLLPRPEELPPMKAGNDGLNATLLLCLILVSCIVLVVLSRIGI